MARVATMSVLECAGEQEVFSSAAGSGVITGRLIGFTDEGRVPLVTYEGPHGTAAVPARTVVDLSGGAIGAGVVLAFERADPGSPIVIGVLRAAGAAATSSPVHVEADGHRMVLVAEEQLVLRCGRASITLTRAGKVLIDGAYVSSRSSGVVRIKGGSIQLN
jgi:hypothetical protein